MNNNKVKVAVVDGKGGGIGKALIERIKKEGLNIELIALGTNSSATTNMLKGGADEAATGENAILYNSMRVDVILGVIAIIQANSMMGELTPDMAMAIGESDALKILIPTNRCNIKIAMPEEFNLQQSIEYAIIRLKEYLVEINE